MSNEPMRDKRYLCAIILLLFLGSILLIAIPIPAEDQDESSRASSRAACPNSTTGWTVTSGTYSGTCTISGGEIRINAGITAVFEAVTMTHSGNYYIHNYGSLTIANSTITGAGGWNGILGESNAPLMKVESTTVTGFDSYGLRAYTGTDRVEIANSTFDGNPASYGFYIYNIDGAGFINNNTIKDTNSYGMYFYQPKTIPVTNNTVSNSGSYGLYSQYLNGDFCNNTLTGGSTNPVRWYYGSPSKFDDNVITGGNSIGLYLLSVTGMTMYNNDLTGNQGTDFQISTSNGVEIYSYNNKFAQTSVSGATLHVYQKANLTAKWLSDNSPVANTELDIWNSQGELDDRDLGTDANGELKGFWLEEYKKSGSKTTLSPYTINISADFDGRDISNGTEGDVEEGEENNFELFLDDVAPPLAVTSPTEAVITNQTTLTIEGQTEKNTSSQYPVWVNIRLGGKLYYPNVNAIGAFSQVVDLPTDATHEIVVKAHDALGNFVEESVMATRDTEKPALSVETPEDETLTNITTVEVAGTTEVGATVTVNDVEVTVDGSGEWSTIVDLEEGDNLITVKAKDIAENWAQDSRMVELDTREPMLIIAEPTDGTMTNEANIRLIGTTENKASVKVNGQPVVLAGTSFQSFLNLVEGNNVITLESCDAAGNCNRTVINVLLDTIPPELELTAPEDEYLTNIKEITISGWTEAGAQVTINGRDADMLGTDWTYDMELREGKNTIKVESEDAVGNKMSITRMVYLDTRPPDLQITSPEDGITVNTPTLAVEGTTESGSLVTVNGNTVALTSGMFDTDVILKEGKNTITITSTDEATNSVEKVLTITLDKTVALDIKDLEEGTSIETTDETYNVSGTADKDATVTVNEIVVKLNKNNEFTKRVDLEMGENTIYVEATDPYGNSVIKEYTVIRKEPPPPPTPPGPSIVGNEGPLGGYLLPVLLVLIIVIVIVVAVAVSSKKKARLAAEEEERKKKEAEEEAARQAAATQQQVMAPPPGQPTVPPPYGVAAAPPPQNGNGYQAYQNGNGYQAYQNGFQNGYAQPTPPTGTEPQPYQGPYQAPYQEMASAEPQAQMYDISPQAQDELDRATRAVEAAESRGEDTSKQRRHLKLAHMFATKGNSEKVIHYAMKALAFE